MTEKRITFAIIHVNRLLQYLRDKFINMSSPCKRWLNYLNLQSIDSSNIEHELECNLIIFIEVERFLYKKNI